MGGIRIMKFYKLTIYQRRTGVKNDDIDDFVRKATEVEKALRGLADGSLNPDDVKIAGIESDAEIAQKEVVFFTVSFS
jgi:hypothetical protein